MTNPGLSLPSSRSRKVPAPAQRVLRTASPKRLITTWAARALGTPAPEGADTARPGGGADARAEAADPHLGGARHRHRRVRGGDHGPHVLQDLLGEAGVVRRSRAVVGDERRPLALLSGGLGGARAPLAHPPPPRAPPPPHT